MNQFITIVAVTVCACALGCSRGEISSEGKILQVVRIRPRGNATPEVIQKIEGVIRAVPSKAPIMERFEWGRIDGDSRGSHCLFVLFNNPQSAYDERFRQAIRQGLNEEVSPASVVAYFGRRKTYLLHDATPHSRTTTHGRLRRAVWVELRLNPTPEEIKDFENTITALPKEISAIERLEWGAATGYDPSEPRPIDPTYRNGGYCLLFLFDDARARDACLSHPAYKEFQSMLEQYEAKTFEREFVAQVESIPRSD